MKILVIVGHPAPSRHFDHALADAYEKGARSAGHEIRRIEVAGLDFPLIREKDDWEHSTPPPVIKDAQADLAWADHLLIIFPLWMGSMPALLKGFFEQLLRPGFAFHYTKNGFRRHLKGKTAHITISMGMPQLVYRWFFGAHGLKSIKRHMLGLVGIKPVRESLIGMVEGKEKHRQHWLEKMENYGREAK